MNIETLYESYSRDVFRFALYLSGNWEDAEDITAETFVRAWVAEQAALPRTTHDGSLPADPSSCPSACSAVSSAASS